jgi:hypothetical protein
LIYEWWMRVFEEASMVLYEAVRPERFWTDGDLAAEVTSYAIS